MAEAAMDFLNSADLPSLPVAVQADCLKTWMRLESKHAAAEASLIAAFWASDGPAADGQKSMAAWLARFTRCTKAAARGQVAASFRIREHRHVDEALAAGAISVSYGRWISDVTKRFDSADRDTLEEILVEAAASGVLIEDLEKIATAALRRLQPGGLERDEARAHADRGLTLAKTFGGAGRMNADLDAEATALAEQVIGALSTKMGPEDDRTARQRRHDALAEAFRRLLGSNLLPERGGAKPHIKADIDLATLRSLPGAREAEDAWVEQQAAALARARLGGATTRDLLTNPPTDQPVARRDDQPPGHSAGHPPASGPAARDRSRPGRGWPSADSSLPPGLTSTGVRERQPHQPELPGLGEGAILAGVGPISHALTGALACDSTMTPTVVGAVAPDALAAMTNEWLHPYGLCGRSADGCGCGLRHSLTADAHARLQETLLQWAIEVLSGPGGLASYLRTHILDGPLATPSIVLDVGADDRTVPAPLERAVRRRDRRCRFPACDHPAELSQVHHITPRSHGGATELWNLVTLCAFHHLIAVHTWSWQIRLNPDGTTTATGPDRRVLHENDPPGDPPRQAA